MTLGLVGRKVGMTRLFTDDGDAVPVTVVDVSNNRVTQIKTTDSDGYAAVQVTFGKRRASRVTKPMAGHFAKAGTEAGSVLREFPVTTEVAAGLKAGATIGADIFKVGQKVDVCGDTLGKGFSGVIKRHHFSSNRATHGNSVSHNKPGSTGQNQSPSKVFPGKRMAGHLDGAEPRDHTHRCRAPAPDDQGLVARLQRRQRRRVSNRQGEGVNGTASHRR